MSTLTNWLAINKRIDSLPPVFAQTAAAWVRAFENELAGLDFVQIMNDFEAHISNYDNPHKVTLAQIENSMFKALWDWYVTGMAPYLPEEYKIPTIEAFEEIVENNPIIWSQIMRDCILNNVYQYQDMVGYRYDQPFYLLYDTNPVQQPTPVYYADIMFPDIMMKYNNTLTSTSIGGDKGLGIFTLFFSFIVKPTTDVWSLELNTTANGSSQTICTLSYTPSTQSFSMTFNSNIWSTSPTFSSSSWNANPSKDQPVEYRGVIKYQQGSFQFSYSAGGTFTTVQSTTGTCYGNPLLTLNTFTLSHPFWDETITDIPATRAISIYPSLLPTDFTEVIFSRT